MSARRIEIGALLNPAETPVATPTPSLYPASAAFNTYVDATRYSYGQRSPSAPAYPLSPVAWENHHYSHSSHTPPSPAKLPPPRHSHHHNPHYNSFDLLVDVAATDDYPRTLPRPMSPNYHPHSPSSPRERPLSPPFDGVQHSERASVRLAARSSVRRPANYRESEEEDQLEDDVDVAYIETHQNRPNKRRYQADGPDARPPPKKRTPPEAYPRHGEVIMTVQVDYAKSSPKSRQTSARPASSKPPKSSEPTSRQNSVRPKRPKKPRLGDEGTPKGSQARVGPAQEYRVFREIKNEQGELVETLVGELQHSRCMSNRYKADDFPRCLSCTRRWAGDTCRFQGVRVFYRSNTGDLRDIDFVSEPVGDLPQMLYPDTWNKPMTEEHRRRVKTVATNSLFEILQQERLHLDRPNLVRRARETDCRATCDTCLTSVFAGSWICTSCGREACSDCHKKVVEICSDPEKKQRMLDTSPFFLICTKRQEHSVEHFRPISRFDPKELEDAITAMELLVARVPKMGSSPPSIPPELSPPSDRTSSTDSLHPSPGSLALPLPHGDASLSALGERSLLLASPENVIAGLQQEFFYPKLPDVVNFGLPYRPVPLFRHSDLHEGAFQSLWKHGVPLVVSGLLELCQIRWTPDYFIREYGTESCLVIECSTDVNKRVTVEEFFSRFGEYEGRDGCWKLKDWPPSTDFKTVFPKLFDDFMNIVPMPDYSRRDGVLNISSHFPANAVGPDLGPKMYNAYASNQDAGSKGSTKLHMDMADAVNIMHFATPREDGGEGGAVWDIFDAKDSDTIRKFLRAKYKDKHQNGGDPIHLQLYYLDKDSLQELSKIHGVTSYRVYQRPGDAVFIPAGCAHQVCNMSDCIKVAVDFVSPENIERCENLTREFQAQMWKEDVLQLKTMLWYAWMSCSRPVYA